MTNRARFMMSSLPEGPPRRRSWRACTGNRFAKIEKGGQDEIPTHLESGTRSEARAEGRRCRAKARRQRGSGKWQAELGAAPRAAKGGTLAGGGGPAQRPPPPC